MHAAGLRYFQEVARRGSVRRAGGALNVASSAVNRQVLKLERELGCALFDRLKGGMRLTAAGEILLRHIVDTLHGFDLARAAIDELRGAHTGHIAIAAVDSLLVDILPRAIDGFRASHPAVTYSVLAFAPAEVPAEVAAGRADIGLTFVGRPPKGTNFIASIAAPLGAVMTAAHPLARRRRVTLADCRAYPLLTQEGPLPRGSDVAPDFAAFRESTSPKLTSNSIVLLKHAVRQNMGIAFFTRLGYLREIADGEMVWKPLASPAINALRMGVLVSTDRALGPVTRTMVDRLVAQLRAVEKS